MSVTPIFSRGFARVFAYAVLGLWGAALVANYLDRDYAIPMSLHGAATLLAGTLLGTSVHRKRDQP